MIEQKINLGHHEAPTRIVFPPMATGAAIKGVPGENTVQHYKRIARNPKVGTIIVEHAFVDPTGKADPYQISLADDGALLRHRELVREIKTADPTVLVIAQISHAGANTKMSVTGAPLVSASAITMKDEEAHALTKEEIAQLRERYVDAARRAIEAGYDGVQVHCAHGYLLNEFFSPLTNHRDDEYGPQSVANRLRFTIEIVRGIRAAVGEGPLLSVRLGGSDYKEGGSTIADAVEAARLLNDETIDLLDLSGGMCYYVRPDHKEPGYFSDMSEAVKAVSRVPVVLTGGVQTPEDADALLAAGKADLIGVGRALFKNANW